MPSGFFTRIQTLWGYWQVLLATKSEVLTFVILWGHLKYIFLCPVDLCSADSEHDQQGSIALSPVNISKIRDDTLIRDSSLRDHFHRLCSVHLCCRKHSITFNHLKLHSAQPEVYFSDFMSPPTKFKWIHIVLTLLSTVWH